MGAKAGAADVDAQHQGALPVAAQGVEAAAQPGLAQNHEDDGHDHQGDDDADFHPGGDQVAVFGRITQPGNLDLGGHQLLKARVGNLLRLHADDGGHAAGKEHPRQGDDEGLNLQIGDQVALHQAERKADAQGDEDGGHDAAAGV